MLTQSQKSMAGLIGFGVFLISGFMGLSILSSGPEYIMAGMDENLVLIAGMGFIGAGFVLSPLFYALAVRKFKKDNQNNQSAFRSPSFGFKNSSLEVELKKLDDLRARRVIDENEYKRLRDNLISRH